MGKNDQLNALVAKRGQIKGHLTRFINFVDSFESSNKTVLELQTRLDKIESYWVEFNDVQGSIESLNDGEEHLAYREEFEDAYYFIVAHAKQIIIEKTPSSSRTRLNETTTQDNLKLPVIPIPHFYGDYREWPNFHDTFNALVNNNTSLNNVQKFYYLRDAVRGEAKQVIDSIELSNDNYKIAFDLLKSRFDNKKLIKRAHVASLFNIPVLTKESHHDLRKFVDDVNKHLRALKNLGESVETWDVLLMHLISSKLDVTTKREWEAFSAKLDDPKVNDMKGFLTDRCNVLETLESSTNKVTKPFIRKYAEQRSLTCVADNQDIRCVFCKGLHFVHNCQNFLKLPARSRFEEIKKLKLCTNCLRPGHFNAVCRASSCKKCNKKHNTLLHADEYRGNSAPTVETQSETSGESQNVTINTHSADKLGTHVLLSTAMVHIRDNNGRYIRCRALLDSGSQSNFMSREFFERSRLSGHKINIPVVGIGQAIAKITHKVETCISSLHNAFTKDVTFLIIDKITDNLPIFSFDNRNLEIPKNITLADPTFNISSQIDILLGAGVFWDLLCVGQIKMGTNEPILQKSKLGWIISGPIVFNRFHNDHSKIQCNLSVDQNLHNQIEKFWSVEECHVQSKLTNEELQCERIFQSTTCRDECGRFVITLPMSGSVEQLGESQENAVKRFLTLESKLNRNAELKQKYTEFMNEYETLHHMTQISDENLGITNNSVYYLPHHGVLKESSTTTKLRVVFDASSKTSSDVSLNDILLVGPTIQDDLFSIILRFRKHNFVIIADVAKMYRQILVTESQRDLQRIVWRTSPEEPLKHYRLNTLTYGTSPASFIATRCLHQLAHENMSKFPRASYVILKDFYMDDLITGAETIDITIEIKQEVSRILENGGFPLRKWISNERSILDKSDDLNNNLSQYYITDDASVKALGLIWNARADVISVTTYSKKCDERVTKRTILSIISQIFDPLGLVGPIIIKAKIILQRLWQLRLEWDESVPSDIFSEWVKFRSQIGLLAKLEIPRRVLCARPIAIQLHGFCDASTTAYGACLYLRSTSAFGTNTVHLLCAKSKVAPLKSLSLPKLELCGALLLARLTKTVKEALDIELTNTYYWTDSSIVLAWLASPSSKWKTFVCNRVAEIQQITSDGNWNHVKSSENPADIISRGSTPESLIHAKLWWSGPVWLTNSQSSWEISHGENVADIPEVKTHVFSAINAADDDIFYRYSSLTKLQRVLAYCFRFYHNLRNKSTKLTGVLIPAEIERSMSALIKLAQGKDFFDELRTLGKCKTVSKKSRLASLNPFVDQEGIIRVGGRLTKANITADRKYPIVLADKHPLTKLIIIHEHIRNLHSGPQATIASIRQTFWPLKCRSIVKQILHQCITCFKVKPTSFHPQMGNLPEYRLQPVRPFYVCGVDYAGPYYIKDGKTRNRKIVKCYLCIFVCFVTKACHLELVGDVTSDSFLNALKRFTSRRGICRDIFSDNGTNFMGANNELREIGELLTQIDNDPKMTQFLSHNQIRWHFIPARSPHLGGLWEAAVKSAKSHIKRVVGNANLTFEGLSTVLVQVEAALNSRPLTPLSEDPNDLIPLTPSHFLIGDVLTSIPQADVTNISTNKLSHYQHLQQLLQHFWKRWSSEYLSTLQIRNKWKHHKPNNLSIGNMVILRNENTPPYHWPVGRIVDLQPGEDGIVRVVSVKTASGIVKRSVTKICVLPIETDSVMNKEVWNFNQT